MENLSKQINAQGKFRVHIQKQMENSFQSTIFQGKDAISFFAGNQKQIEAYLERFLNVGKKKVQPDDKEKNEAIFPTDLEMLPNLACLLREARLSRDLRLKDVASGVGLSVPYLSDLERGRTNPSLATLQRLSNFYGEKFGLENQVEKKVEIVVNVGGKEITLAPGKSVSVTIGGKTVFSWDG